MTIEELKSQLCADMVLGAFERNGTSFIATRFSYPIGDSVNIYLVECGGIQKISDLGTTNFILRTQGINPESDERLHMIQAVCALYDVDADDDMTFAKAINEKSVGQDALAFCEAITRISTLQYERRPSHYSGLESEVEGVLSTAVGEKHYSRKWFARNVDPEGFYPVDYHMNSVGEPRDIFVVGTRLRAETTVGTINFLQAHGQDHQTIAIIAPQLGLPRKVERKLEKNAGVIFGVAGNEDRIGDFAARR